MRSLRWGDLADPRAVYGFTLGDAWRALPTLLAMFGLFLGAVLILFLIKKLLELIFLSKQTSSKYTLERSTPHPDAAVKTIRKRWIQVPVHHLGSVLHILFETLFLAGIVVAAYFAAAVGDVNIWQNPLASTAIGIIITYVFSSGLVQVGSGYFVFLCNSICLGEYWQMSGTSIEGRVCRITPLFVELEAKDPEHGGALLHRATMTQVLTGTWTRNFYKEYNSDPVSIDGLVLQQHPAPLTDNDDDLEESIGMGKIKRV